MLLKIVKNRWSTARVLTVLAIFYFTFGILYGAYKMGIVLLKLPADAGKLDVTTLLLFVGLGAFFGAIYSVPYTVIILVGVVLGFLLLRWLPLNFVLKTFLLTTIVTGISWFMLRTVVYSILVIQTGAEEIIVYSIIFVTTATILWRSGWMNHTQTTQPTPAAESASTAKPRPSFLGIVFAFGIFGGMQVNVALSVSYFLPNHLIKKGSLTSWFPLIFSGYFPVGMILGLSAALCGFIVWKIATKQNWNQKRSCFAVAFGMMFGAILAFAAARVWYLETLKTVLEIDFWWLEILASLIAGISGYFLCLGFPKTSPKPQEAAKKMEPEALMPH